MGHAIQRDIHGVGMATKVGACFEQRHLAIGLQLTRGGQATDAGAHHRDATGHRLGRGGVPTVCGRVHDLSCSKQGLKAILG